MNRPMLTEVGCWLIRIGIEVRHIRPYHPQSNGKAERFHRTLRQEVISPQTFSDLRPCQRVFDRWRADYNLRRPHEAPAYAVPAARYQPGPRRFPERLPAVEYETGVAVRKVNGDGTVPFKGQPYRIGKALKQPYVALRATTQDDTIRGLLLHPANRQTDPQGGQKCVSDVPAQV